MNWFSSKPSPNLKQLLLQKHEILLTEPQLAVRVEEHFGRYLDQCLRKMSIASETFETKLYRMSIGELTGALYLHPNEWVNWQKNQIEDLIPQLLKFVQWKYSIEYFLTTQQEYDSVKIQQLAEMGAKVLPHSQFLLTTFSQDEKTTRRKRLYQYIVGQNDRENEVLIRVFRCIILRYRYLKPSERNLLACTSDLKFVLKPSYLESYLYEQLALCVFLRDNQKENAFIDDTRPALYHFVSEWLWNQSKDSKKIASYIVQDTQVAIYEKLWSYITHPNDLYIDTLMNSYVIGYFKNHRKNFIKPYLHKYEVKFLDEENLPSTFDVQPISEDLTSLIRECILSLSLRCQVILKLAYGSYYSIRPTNQAIADEMMLTKNTVDHAAPNCEQELKILIIDRAAIRKISLKPWMQPSANN